MNIKVNNDAQQIEANQISISELLIKNNVEMPEMVSVQLNGKFIKREDYITTLVQENDEIDFLYFMGGGRPVK